MVFLHICGGKLSTACLEIELIHIANSPDFVIYKIQTA